jgi:cellulose biosynthesis protein BcsQ
VFSFYSLRGGEERTRLLVHTALQIRAKRRYLQSTDSVVRPILVADMDIHAPALSDYFRCEDGDARGLVGLASDYTRAPAPERLDLLRAGLLSEQYVHRVHEGLYLLPVGRKGENGFLHLRQWIEAFARGRVDPKDPPTLADGGFLGDLRRALVETFFMVLVDSAPGLSDSSYASTVGIADAVVVSLRPSRSELEGSRVLVESMRWRQGDLGGVKGWTPIIPALIEEESMVASSQEAFFRQDVEPAFFPRQTTTAPVGTTSSWYPQPTWIDLGEDSDLRRMCPQLTGRKFYLRARASLAEEIRGIRGASQVAACTRAMLDPDRDSLWHQVATGAMVVPSSESACVQRQMRVSAERAISQGSGGRGRIELVEQNAQRLLKHKRVEVDV